MKRGKLVSIEGLSGSGKSTLCKSLLEYFKTNFPDTIVAVVTYPRGSFLHELELSDLPNKNAPITKKYSDFLFFCELINLQNRLIEHLLKEGAIVFSDRFVASTMAYQFYKVWKDLSYTQMCTLLKSLMPDPDVLKEEDFLMLFLDTSYKNLEYPEGDDVEIRGAFLDLIKKKFKKCVSFAGRSPPKILCRTVIESLRRKDFIADVQ